MKTLRIPSFLLIGIIGVQTTFAYDMKGMGTEAAKGAGNAMAGQVVAQSGSAGALSFGVRAGLNLGKIEHSQSEEGKGEHESSYNGTVQNSNKYSYTTTSDASSMGGNLIGFQVGAVLDVKITDFLYVQPGIMLSSKGSETEVTRDNDDEDINSMLTRTRSSKTKTNMKINPYYIDVPIMLSLKGTLADNLALRAQAGPYFSFGLFGGAESSYKRERSEDGIPDILYNMDPDNNVKTKVKNVFSPKAKEKEEFSLGNGEGFGGLNRFNCGIGFGGGIEFNGFYLGVSYNMGLTNLLKKVEYSNVDEYDMMGNTTTNTEKGSYEPKAYERTFSITLGYNF